MKELVVVSELAYKQVNIGYCPGLHEGLVVVSELAYKQVNIGYSPQLHDAPIIRFVENF